MNKFEVGDVVSLTCAIEPFMTVTHVDDEYHSVRVCWLSQDDKLQVGTFSASVLVLMMKRARAEHVVSNEFAMALAERER